ncbi:GNAT family N-acetyltransferase [Arsenicicoccus dermatophilus]|uniref:GNAT family N-acetyltransferase n=1 Tax=Arsenicicoccus dermatophilus TaxID=1076331 RepID=UPI0039172946
MSITDIREARADELALLPALDQSGSAHFRRAGMHLVADMPAPPPEAYAEDQAAGRLLVACDEHDEPLGFVQLAVVDGDAHVAQLSVHPRHSGQRIGARLLEAAEQWARRQGLHRLSLTTYSGVPWNAPYYARLGWRTLPEAEWGSELRAVRDHERELGLDAWPRVAMVREVTPGRGRPVLRTERIELRPMTIEHLPLLHRLDSDPEVMRHLLGRARTPQEIDAYWTPRCTETVADAVGLGWWVGFAGDDFLGWWDLGRSDHDPWVTVDPDSAEIGWRLERRHWRQGLATEGAQALLRHGFETVGLQRVYAETMAVNVASRGVMRKLGMSHVRTDVRAFDDPLPGADQGEVVYEITAEQWRRTHGTEAGA